MENSPLEQMPAQDRLLVLLKTRGRSKAGDLAVTLGVTHEAVRQQLMRLQAEGLVEATAEARGVGRPAQFWNLTVAANRRFPDSHAELTAQLLGTIRKTLGESALEKVIAAREKELFGRYTEALKDVGTTRERIKRLASIRTAEGYMAEWQADSRGFRLIENHCPICQATAVCVQLCRAELELLKKVLGPGVMVKREEFILAGSRRCSYRVEPRKRNGKRARYGAKMTRF